MDARTFLATVVAWDSGGYVTVHWYRKGHKRWFGRSHQAIDDVFTTVADIETTELYDVFFCLSTQTQNQGSRSRKNALALRSVWMDFDVDPNDPKKYPTIRAAFDAMINFCRLLEIPYPSFVVRSGGGLHVYWCSDRSLTVEEWQPYADLLKTAARNCDLKVDFAVMADAVRILRFPGTFNRKQDKPRPVEIVEGSDGAQLNFAEAFKKIFADYAKSDGRLKGKVEIADAFKGIDPHHTLNDSIIQREAPLLPFESIKAECAWLRDVHDTGGEDYGNELWAQSVYLATFLQDGHDLAHEFSDKYPKYRYAETENKWNEKLAQRESNPELGWTACKTIQDMGCRFCDSCPHLHKDKSPLNIGYEAILNEVIDEEMRLLGGRRPPRLRLPAGFCVDLQERICAFIPSAEGKTGKVIGGKLVWLFGNTIVGSPKLETIDGIGGISFTTKPTNISEKEIFLCGTNLYKDNLLNALAVKGVVYNADDEAVKMIRKFAPAWLEKLRIEDTPTPRDLSMGWRHEEGRIVGFVYGNKLYREDGTVLPVVGGSDDEFRSWYTPTGERKYWVEAARLLTDRKRPELDILIAAAFAAPLCVFAGTLYGPVLVIWGEPGTSKSTGQQVASALYGHPKQTRESLSSTPKSIQGRLGRIKNLPAWWDDVQDERHLEALFQTMFVASEGAEGGRLNPDASYKIRLHWQTILIACANASFVEFLTRKQKSTTAGMRRVFEIQFNRGNRPETGLINQLEASKAFARLEHNFGVIGAEYAAFLGLKHNEISVLVQRVIDRFTAKVAGTADESYWTGLCGVLIVGAMLSRQFGCEISLQRLEDFLVRSFLENRRIRSSEGTEGGSYDNTEHAITGFCNHYFGSGNFMVSRFMFKDRHHDPVWIASPNTGKPLYIQICRDERILIISKKALREYLEDHDIRARQVYEGLEKWFHAREAKLTLGAGTKCAQTQELCFVLPVKSDSNALFDVMTAFGTAKN